MPIDQARLDDVRFLLHELLDLIPCRDLPSMAAASPNLIEYRPEEGARLSEG